MIQALPELGFVEVMFEELHGRTKLPSGLAGLVERGVPVIVHGVTLSLGSDEPVSESRLSAMAEVVRRTNGCIASEHIAYTRVGATDAGHLLPLPRTKEALDAIATNAQRASQVLGVPLALENISTLFEWPDAEMTEPQFIAAILERTGAELLLDVSNHWGNSISHAFDARASLARVPIDRIAYVHIGGGVVRDGVYHDTHADPVTDGALELLGWVVGRASRPPVLLERDDRFPPVEILRQELATIRATLDAAPG
jgi:uncharacterized protein